MILQLHGRWYALNDQGEWAGSPPSGFTNVRRWDRLTWEATHPDVPWLTGAVTDWHELGYWTLSGTYHRPRVPASASRPAAAPTLPNGILVDEPWPETDDL